MSFFLPDDLFPWLKPAGLKPTRYEPPIAMPPVSIEPGSTARQRAYDAYDDYQEAVQSSPELPDAPASVRPAFRTMDLVAGGLPIMLMALAGKGQDAAAFASGYLGAKNEKAQLDTQDRFNAYKVGRQQAVDDYERNVNAAKLRFQSAQRDYEDERPPTLTPDPEAEERRQRDAIFAELQLNPQDAAYLRQTFGHFDTEDLGHLGLAFGISNQIDRENGAVGKASLRGQASPETLQMYEARLRATLQSMREEADLARYGLAQYDPNDTNPDTLAAKANLERRIEAAQAMYGKLWRSLRKIANASPNAPQGGN